LGDISVRTEYGYYLIKPEKSSSFSQRDVVEQWLLELSASRRRYEPLDLDG
ncbi:MAG: LysR family transcriptional regulator, partial [Marinovum sp.]|nr:LysR family transcriptional regulator [Marinovum sp.]